MKESIETLRPYLARGIPELDIPAIEPINLGDLIVAESVPGQGISITAKDIKAYGPSNYRLKKLKWIPIWTSSRQVIAVCTMMLVDPSFSMIFQNLIEIDW